MTFKTHIMKLLPDGSIASDNHPTGLVSGSWCVSLFGEHLWLAHFSTAWRERYPTTWAAGWGRKVWWYTP